MKRQQRLGFKVFPEMITSYSPDDVIRSICDENGIAFFAVTNEFRSKAMAQLSSFNLTTTLMHKVRKSLC